MRREEAEHLVHHHYRLHTQIRSRIDNKPPKSMFVSPKSTHYQPLAARRPKSLETTPKPKRRGQEELTHFLSHKHSSPNNTVGTPNAAASSSSLNSSFNAHARRSMSNLATLLAPSAASSRPSTSKQKPLFDRSAVRPRILDTDTYHPPLRRGRTASVARYPVAVGASGSAVSRETTVNGGGGRVGGGTRAHPNGYGVGSRGATARTSSGIADTKRKLEFLRNSPKYLDFKNAVLNQIMRRGIFSDRVIKDCFYSEIEKRPDLDLNVMEDIMFDTLRELEVQVAETAPAGTTSSTSTTISRSLRPKTAKPRRVTIDGGQPTQIDVTELEELSIVNDDDEQSEFSTPTSSKSSSTTASSASGSGSGSRSGSDSERSSASTPTSPGSTVPTESTLSHG